MEAEDNSRRERKVCLTPCGEEGGKKLHDWRKGKKKGEGRREGRKEGRRRRGKT